MTVNLHLIRTILFALPAAVVLGTGAPAARADFVDGSTAFGAPAPFGNRAPFAPAPAPFHPDWTSGGWGDPLEHHINPSPSDTLEPRLAQVPPLGIGHLPDPDLGPAVAAPDWPRQAGSRGAGSVPAPGAIGLLLLGLGGRRRR